MYSIARRPTLGHTCGLSTCSALLRGRSYPAQTKVLSLFSEKQRQVATARSTCKIQAVEHCSQSLHSLTATDEERLRQQAVRAALDLKKRGWAALEGVLSREECEAYQDGFWEWLAGLGTGIKRNDPSTWKEPAWPPSFRGIINSLEVAHQAFVWRVRKNPKLLRIFEELWGTNALLSSFDSINALPAGAEPPQQAWLHVDQAPWRRGVCCVQGLVNLVDVSAETTGTLLVKDGTHGAHDHFFTAVSQMPLEKQKAFGDHYKFSSAELPHWNSHESVGVRGSAGSLFLWDSRAVHANVFPRKVQAFRHVVYACYQPAAMATEADLREKRRAYDEYLLTTHWPAMNIRLYERNQAIEYYGVEGASKLPEYKLQRTRHLVEDRQLLQLAGVEPYVAQDIVVKAPLVDMLEDELLSLLA